MVRRWQYSSRFWCWLSVASATLSLVAVGIGRSAAAPNASNATVSWEALRQKVESLDTSKPEAVAALKGMVADLVRLNEAQAREIESLRAELQTLRSTPSSASSSRRTPAKTAGSREETRPSTAATASGDFFGKPSAHKVHRKGCIFGERIKETDRAYFKTLEEATKAGFEPCKVCKPDK